MTADGIRTINPQKDKDKLFKAHTYIVVNYGLI